MFVYERSVRFEDVDAANIVFFSRFLNYCHEAMEALLQGLEGGYASLVIARRIGVPAVRVEADFKVPLRFGDLTRIGVVVEHLGRSSIVFRYEFSRAHDHAPVATIRHVVVVSDLNKLKSVPMPDDLRALLDQHKEA